MTRPVSWRVATAAWISVILLGTTGAGPQAYGQSAEFRRAVDEGQRDRLRQVVPGSTPLELALAEPDRIWQEGAPDLPGAEAGRACRLSIQYALALGDSRKALRTASRCAQSPDAGEPGFEAQWLLMQSEFLAGRVEAALKRADWLSRHASEPWKGRGLFGQAQCALAQRDTVEALRLFKLCARLKEHEVAAPAHLELGRLHEARGASEQAMHYFTLYRESYPRGLVPQFEFAPGASARADEAAGVEYTIQVGVFGEHANAVRQAERFKQAGYKVELKPRTLSGQKYTAVWVGRYRTQNEAQEARRRLEERFSETFRVVVRE